MRPGRRAGAARPRLAALPIEWSDSTFSERNYGASSFLDFAEKLAQSGLVQLKHSGRSVMVELTPGFSDDGDTTQKPRPASEADTGEAATA